MRFIINLSILLYPLLVSSRGILWPVSCVGSGPTIYCPNDDSQIRNTGEPQSGIEAWPDILPTITCETTYRSPPALDVVAITYDLASRHSHIIRIGDAGDTHHHHHHHTEEEEEAWTVAGKSGGAAVGVYVGYGVGVSAVMPVRAVKMILYKCRKRIGGVERVGGRADFATGTVVDVYRVR